MKFYAAAFVLNLASAAAFAPSKFGVSRVSYMEKLSARLVDSSVANAMFPEHFATLPEMLLLPRSDS